MHFVLYKGKEKYLATPENLLQKIEETNCDTIKVARNIDDLQAVLNKASVDQFGENVVEFVDSLIEKAVDLIPTDFKDFTSVKK